MATGKLIKKNMINWEKGHLEIRGTLIFKTNINLLN